MKNLITTLELLFTNVYKGNNDVETFIKWAKENMSVQDKDQIDDIEIQFDTEYQGYDDVESFINWLVSHNRDIEQNVPYELNGQKIVLQFHFCQNCKSFKNCYSDGSPHYISPECMEDFHNGLIDG